MANTNLEINKDSYVAFDATSLRDLIVSRLSRDKVFTEQVYVGSNISSIIEIISYSFSTLMFYLNKTATESMFTETQLYENMNRIVKMLGYKPLGYQAASVDITLSAINVTAGLYTIPRYTQVNSNSKIYSFNTDFTFQKTTNNTLENIKSASTVRLYQGRYFEYPTHTATAVDNETIILSVTDTLYVDHNSIDVYVKKANTNTWFMWEQVESVSNRDSEEQVYEIRFNENKLYEIVFGDDINGKKLDIGDKVSIYYLAASGTSGEVNSKELSGSILQAFNSPNYSSLFEGNPNYGTILSADTNNKLVFNNVYPSTSFSMHESVDDIRKRASNIFKSQGRLVTISDYETYINSHFNYFIKDIRVKNNVDYLESYIQYFYNVGLSNPYTESRVLHNQVQYANTNNVNNIYLFCLPRGAAGTYLMPQQRSYILDSIEPIKCATSQVVFADPIYMSADIAVATDAANPSVSDRDVTKIYIEKEFNSNRGSEALKNYVITIISEAFASFNNILEPEIDVLDMKSSILQLEGVKRVYCENTTTGVRSEGLSFIVWNSIYTNDIKIITQNTKLEFFKTVVLYDIQSILDRIVVL